MQQILFYENFSSLNISQKKCLKSCVFHAAAKEGEERIPAGEDDHDTSNITFLIQYPSIFI